MQKKFLANENLGEKIVKKGFRLYFFSFLIGPAGYITKVLISNSSSISVADVGILYSITSLIAFINIYNDLGLTESLQYFLPRYWIKKEFNNIKSSIIFSLGIQLLTAIIIAIILWYSADRLAIHYFQSEISAQILKIFCIYFFGINLFQTLQSIFIAFQQTFDHQFVEFIRMWTIVIFTVLFFFIGQHSILVYSMTRLVGLAAGIIVASIIYKKKYHHSLMQGHLVYNKIELQKYIKYAGWAFIGLNIGVIFSQLTQQLVILRLGADAAGYYTNFLSLMNITTVIISPIIGLVFPMVSELVSKKDHDKLNLLFYFFYTYFSILSLSMAIFLTFLGPEIAVTLFGEKFRISGLLLVWGALFSVVANISNFNFSVLAGIGKIKERVKIMGIAVVFLFIAVLVGMQLGKLYGAVIGFGLTYILLSILSFKTLKKSIHFNINYSFLIKNCILLGLLGLIIYIVKSKIFILVDAMRRYNMLALVGMGSVFYSILLLFNLKEFKFLRKELQKLRQNTSTPII